MKGMPGGSCLDQVGNSRLHFQHRMQLRATELILWGLFPTPLRPQSPFRRILSHVSMLSLMGDLNFLIGESQVGSSAP